MYLASHRGDYLRARRGDPGVFGFLGSAVKKVAGIASAALPGPVGAAVRGVSSLLSGPSRTAPVRSYQPTVAPISRMPAAGSFQVGRYERTGYEGTVSLPSRGVMGTEGCPKGYRPNRSAYFTKDGQYHEVGTKCVKYRYRNVANGRALGKAINRTAAFNRLVKKNRKNLRALATL